jgi:cation diffusion facilitator family transporter
MESSYKLKTLKISTVAISSVVLVEVSLGMVVGSLAILGDGLHALFDALTTLVLFIATRASARPPDEEHMYGHEKFESLGGLIGGITLVGIALVIIYEAVFRILRNENINQAIEYVGFGAVGYTFCIDFLRVGILNRARRSESSTLKAGLYHAIADLSSTVIAFLGFGLATLGFGYGDSLASIILGSFLSYLSVRLIWSSGMELSDTITKDVADKVRKEILNTKGVYKCENLKIRKAGDKTFVRATIQVPDYLSFEGAHEITSKIESNVKNSLGNVDVTIHAEPLETEMRTEKLVEKLAKEVHGVREVHEIDIVYTDGKLYITLHAHVDPKISVEKAHEIAEKIEETIEERIRNLENVTVHIEPFSSQKRKGSMAHEDEIRKIITEMVKTDLFRIKRILTYVADKRRYINIDFALTEQVSIEEAHKIASEIEEKVKAKFAETTVTVHIEPKKKEGS